MDAATKGRTKGRTTHADHGENAGARDTGSAPVRAQSRLAASYARTAADHPSVIEAQHRRNTQQASHDGFQIPCTALFRFSDNGASALTANREALQQLIAVIESGFAPFERIYIEDRARFGRFADADEFHYWLARITRSGIPVCFVAEAGMTAVRSASGADRP